MADFNNILSTVRISSGLLDNKVQFNATRLPRDSIVREYNTTINHPPLRESCLIYHIRNEIQFRNANCPEHRLLPEATATNIRSECIHQAHRSDAFNWPRNDTECKRLCVVLIPSLNVECQNRCVLSELPDTIKGANVPPNRVMTVFHPIPRFCDAAKISTSSEVFTASTP